MSIFRKNMITNDWVIFAPNRSKRPRDLKFSDPDNIQVLKDRPEYKHNCPFCPGNEEPDAEVFRLEHEGRWKIRIVKNKYSSVERGIVPERRQTPLFKEMDGFGIHDVIIDNPRHNNTIALFTQEELVNLLDAYQQRAVQIRENGMVRHIVIFKNQGIKAGGSLEHPHSQIYGLPLMPFEMQIRLKEAERYYELNDHCMLCDILREEMEGKTRIFYENDHFVSLSPYAALSPYHFWLVPKHHSPSFLCISPAEVLSLADIIKASFVKLFVHQRNPDFNFVFQSLAYFERERNYYHWYVSVIPQVKQKGGLEYAGGFFVNPVMPEYVAEEFRRIDHMKAVL